MAYRTNLIKKYNKQEFMFTTTHELRLGELSILYMNNKSPWAVGNNYFGFLFAFIRYPAEKPCEKFILDLRFMRFSIRISY